MSISKFNINLIKLKLREKTKFIFLNKILRVRLSVSKKFYDGIYNKADSMYNKKGGLKNRFFYTPSVILLIIVISSGLNASDRINPFYGKIY